MAIGDSLANPNLWVDGDVAFNDAISGGTPRFISIPLRAGQLYYFLVTGSGGTFDAFLTLYDTLDNAQAVLATDDNSLDMVSEPLISFTAPVTGIYYLGCSTLDFDGSFAFIAGADPSGAELTYFRMQSENKISNIYKNKSAMFCNNISNFFQFRSKLLANLFNIVDVHRISNSNSFSILANMKTAGSSASYSNIWKHTAYEIFANGVLIGVLPEGVTVLTDVAIPDGEYEIEARPVGNFYREVSVSQLYKVVLDSIDGVANLLPDIFNLSSIIKEARTYIGFTIKPPVSANNLKIGMWFGDSSDIDISGSPDVVFNSEPSLKFNYSYKQTVAQWVAVAFYDGSERGEKQEIELVWVTTLPDSPSFQHIE